MAVNWNRRTFTRHEFELAWKQAESIADVARTLGLTIYGSTYPSLRNVAVECGLDESHMVGSAWRRGATIPVVPARALEEVLVEDVLHTNSKHLKERLISSGLLVEKCAICGSPPEWWGAKLVLQLDHINGNRFDNRIENLRLLCPNCHSQTKTFCRRK